MGRLIDIDNAIALIDEEIRVLAIRKKQDYKSKIEELSYIKDAIKHLPTAYDVEKVVAELEELPIHDSEGHWGEYLDKENVIEIVRKGGWNE